MKPLVRWTIGPVKPSGFECLSLSIKSFTKLYDVEVIICHNCEIKNLKSFSKYNLYDQRKNYEIPPIGVSWKLYPPRMGLSRHEIVIDNDIVFQDRIEEIEKFLDGDCTLLLEDIARTYGKFENFVPPGFQINSGIYGMPPEFNLEKYIDFYVKNWEINAQGDYLESKTFDEQGLIAMALLNHPRYIIIPNTIITNCERELNNSNGMHFVGINRKDHHRPFQLFKNRKIYL